MLYFDVRLKYNFHEHFMKISYINGGNQIKLGLNSQIGHYQQAIKQNLD